MIGGYEDSTGKSDRQAYWCKNRHYFWGELVAQPVGLTGGGKLKESVEHG